jgi:hypothetical protein
LFESLNKNKLKVEVAPQFAEAIPFLTVPLIYSLLLLCKLRIKQYRILAVIALINLPNIKFLRVLRWKTLGKLFIVRACVSDAVCA